MKSICATLQVIPVTSFGGARVSHVVRLTTKHSLPKRRPIAEPGLSSGAFSFDNKRRLQGGRRITRLSNSFERTRPVNRTMSSLPGFCCKPDSTGLKRVLHFRWCDSEESSLSSEETGGKCNRPPSGDVLRVSVWT